MNKYHLDGDLVALNRKTIINNPDVIKGQNPRILASCLGFRTISAMNNWFKASLPKETPNED